MNLFRKIFLIILIVNLHLSLKAETLEDLSKEISDIREEISNLETSTVQEAVKIDKALKEVDQVMDFVEKQINSGDVKTAIATLSIAETTVKDINKVIPEKFVSEKVKEGTKFNEQQMKDLSKVTNGIKSNKQKKNLKLSNDIVEATSKNSLGTEL